jgi:hypothetical protein
VAVRLLTMAVSWWIFRELLIAGFHCQAANVVGLTAGLAANYHLAGLVLDRPMRIRLRLRREGRRNTVQQVSGQPI